MGEVYRARDTRLERTVAIKVLPDQLSGSAEVRQRFEREAKAISQLSHPHICALYDVGNQDGVEYLVMEYLEGETLADRLVNGPLPLNQMLRYGAEIADALDKAHRQGIVHRDLKPGNVMLTKTGVKLLDFGLAKAIAPDYALGAHTASLGLTFNTSALFPQEMAGGAFIGQHGSWNRKPYSGYKVLFVPFENGKPKGDPVEVLTGFLSADEKAYGRPVGVTFDKSGALLVADDVGNVIWRVTGQISRSAMRN